MSDDIQARLAALALLVAEDQRRITSENEREKYWVEVRARREADEVAQTAENSSYIEKLVGAVPVACECGCKLPAPIAKQDRPLRGHIKGQPCRFRHGHTPTPWRRKHGASNTAEYFIYHGARQRCENPKNPRYGDYGGRGLRFTFTSIEQFMAELGPRPGPDYSCDRIDVNVGYEPGNIRWATRVQQEANKRVPRGRSLVPDDWQNPMEAEALTRL